MMYTVYHQTAQRRGGGTQIIYVCMLCAFLGCTKNPVSSGKDNGGPKTDFSVLSSRDFIEPSYGSTALDALSGDLHAEFGARLSPALKAEIDVWAHRGLSKKAVADTLLPQTSVDTLLMIGLEAIMKRSVSTALYAYLSALSIEQSASIYSKIGFCLNYLGRYGEARAMLLRARELEPDDAVIHANLAFSYRGLKNLERAIYELSFAAFLEPRNAQFKIGLARLYMEAGKNSSASRILQQARFLSPNHPDIAPLMEALPDPEQAGDGSPLITIDPFNTSSSLVTITDSIAIFRGVIDSTVLDVLAEEDHTSNVNDQNFSNRMAESAEQCKQCEIACRGDLGCEIQCLVQECERDQIILAECAATEKSLIPAVEYKMRKAIALFSMNAFGVLYRHPDALDRDMAVDMLYQTLNSAEEYIISWYSGTDSTIGTWSQYVGYVCEDAAQQYHEFDWESYYRSDIDVDACVFIFCVTITGSEITMSVSAGIIQAEVSVDMVSGDFGFGVGAGLNAGVFEAGAMFKIGTAGAQLKAGVSTAGPLKFKKEFSYQLINL